MNNKYGKLHFAPNLTTTLGNVTLLRKRIPVFVSYVDNISDATKTTLAMKHVSKLMQQGTVFDALPRRSKYNFNIALVEDDKKWLANWSPQSKILELNVKMGSKLPKSKFNMNFAFALGIVYYDQCLPPAWKKYWKKLIRKDKSLNITLMPNKIFFSADNLGKARYAFGLGWLRWAVRVPGIGPDMKALGKLMGEFLHKIGVDAIGADGQALNPETSTVLPYIDPKNPLGVQLNPNRFDFMQRQMAQFQGRKYPIGDGRQVSLEDLIDAGGQAQYGSAIFEYLRNNPMLTIEKAEYDENGVEITPAIKKRAFDYFNFDPTQPFDQQVRIDFNVFPGGTETGTTFSMYSPNGKRLCEVNRRLASRQYNQYCIANKAIRGLGLGVQMTTSQMLTALKTNQKVIAVNAAGDAPPNENSLFGYSVWNKFGFDAPMSRPTGWRSRQDGVKFWDEAVKIAWAEIGAVDAIDIMRTLLTTIPVFKTSAIRAANPVQVEEEGKKTLNPEEFKNLTLKILTQWQYFSTGLNNLFKSMGLPPASNREQGTLMKRWINQGSNPTVTSWVFIPSVQSSVGLRGGINLGDPLPPFTSLLTEEDGRRLLEYMKNKNEVNMNSWLKDLGVKTLGQGQRQVPRNDALSDMIESWGWLPEGLLTSKALQDFALSPSLEMQNIYGAWDQGKPPEIQGFTVLDVGEKPSPLKQLYDYMINNGLHNYLSKFGLNPKEQNMQALMEVKNPVGTAKTIENDFATWWTKKGGWDWNGELDLKDGMYSIPILILDQYRKLKAAHPNLGGDEAWPRARVAAPDISKGDTDPIYLNSLEEDQDEYEGFDILQTEAGGAFKKEDIVLIGKARDIVMKMLKEKDKKVASLFSRLATQWLKK